MIDGGDVDCTLVFINCDNGIVAYIEARPYRPSRWQLRYCTHVIPHDAVCEEPARLFATIIA
jgi:hypothetical protein